MPKCAAFENLSTTTKIAVLVWKEGSPTMKSREMSSHTTEGNGIGCKASAMVSWFVGKHTGINKFSDITFHTIPEHIFFKATICLVNTTVTSNCGQVKLFK